MYAVIGEQGLDPMTPEQQQQQFAHMAEGRHGERQAPALASIIHRCPEY